MFSRTLSAALLFVLGFAPLAAQESVPIDEPGALHLELNALAPAEAGCRISFVARNDLDQAVERAGIEMALFTTEGAVERIVTLDFVGLTPGRTKVLQFELPDLDCEALGQVLVNDIVACEGADLAPTACLAALETSARPDIIFGL